MEQPDYNQGQLTGYSFSFTANDPGAYLQGEILSLPLITSPSLIEPQLRRNRKLISCSITGTGWDSINRGLIEILNYRITMIPNFRQAFDGVFCNQEVLIAGKELPATIYSDLFLPVGSFLMITGGAFVTVRMIDNLMAPSIYLNLTLSFKEF